MFSLKRVSQNYSVMVCEKKNGSLTFSVDRKIPNPLVHRSSGKLGKPRFPTGTVDHRVGIFLSPQNTNDGFYLYCLTSGKVILLHLKFCWYILIACFFSATGSSVDGVFILVHETSSLQVKTLLLMFLHDIELLRQTGQASRAD